MGTQHATVRKPVGDRPKSVPGKRKPGDADRAKPKRKAHRQAAHPKPRRELTVQDDGYSHEQLGRDLRLVRERRGLSQQAVAEALGLPRSAVSNMETGRRRVNTIELGKLADIYGCAIGDLVNPRAESHVVDLAAALHRALPELRDEKDTESAIMHVIGACRDGAKFREILGRPEIPPIPAYPSRATGASDAIRQGEAAAHEERRRLGLGATPILNIARLLNNEGVWCTASRLPDGISGLFLCHPTVGMAILANREHVPERRNFSCAHEYAHALFDREEIVTATRRDAVSPDLREKRANAFAAAFLIPPDGASARLARIGKGRPSRHEFIGYSVADDAPFDAEVRPKAGSQAITPHDIAALAHYYCVSQECVIWRLLNLGHIGPREREALIASSNLGADYVRLLGPKDSGETDSRQDNGDLEFRHQVVQLAFDAFRMREITGGRLRETAWHLSLAEFPLSDLAAGMCYDDPARRN